MIASTVNQCFKDSKICNNTLAATNMLGAMGKTSLVLLGVELYSYFQSAVACFNVCLVLKKVWTQP